MGELPNPTGSDAELTMADYIRSQMENEGYTVVMQNFHEGFVDETGVDQPGVNILAERGANSKDNRKTDIMLITTHYDSKRNPSEDDPFASDKTGAACLIEAARIVARVETDTDICFLFLSGEEDGHYGASSFLETLSDENRSRIVGVIDVERVGYNPVTPYVMKTLTGEENNYSQLIKVLAIASGMAMEPGAEVLPPVAQGVQPEPQGALIEENDLEHTGSSQSITAESDQSILGELQDGIPAAFESELQVQNPAPAPQEAQEAQEPQELQEAQEPETQETGAEPEQWTVLKDEESPSGVFAKNGITAVTLTQYYEPLDGALLWGAAGIENETGDHTRSEGFFFVDEEAPEEESEALGGFVEVRADFPLPDSDRIAALTDVLALTLTNIMDSSS